MVKSNFLDEAEAFSAFFVVAHRSGNSGDAKIGIAI
jgi:hypothetical protein